MDADDKHGHGEVEQNAGLDQQRRRVDEQQAETGKCRFPKSNSPQTCEMALVRAMSKINPHTTVANEPGTSSDLACSGRNGSSLPSAAAPMIAAAPSRQRRHKTEQRLDFASMFAARNARRSRLGMMKPFTVIVPMATGDDEPVKFFFEQQRQQSQNHALNAAARITDGSRLLASATRLNPSPSQ